MSALHVLRQYPSFRFMWMGKSVSGLGDAIAQIAMVLYVYHVAGSTQAVGSLLFVQVIPRLFGPVAGVFVDRMEQKKLLMTCDLLQAGLFSSLAVIHPALPVLLLVVAGSIAISTLSAPAGRSAMTAILKKDALLQANVLLGVSANLNTMLGPAIGGFLVAWAGPSQAFAMNAVTFLCSAVLLRGLPRIGLTKEWRPGNPATQRFAEDFMHGMRYIASQPLIRLLAVTLFIYVGFAALDNIALVFLAHQSLHVGDWGYGWLSAAYGIGLLLGTLFLLRKPSTARPLRTLVMGFGLFGLGTVLTGLAPTLAIAMLCNGMAAFGNSLENVTTDFLIQHIAPREMLGRIFGTISSSLYLGSSIAYAAGGWLAGHLSPRSVLVLSGSGVLISVAFASWRFVQMGFPLSQAIDAGDNPSATNTG